ncbi:uncharacterized protein [Miscanthus floridulus]|uniref:uncharacterized protein n=1 Tax=Miscanthus floridulus TaxID=154761 RepID=UPI003457752F
MLKGKLSNFKMKDDESIPEMFYRLQVIINDLKNLGEKVKDEDFSHKFLTCLPKRFKTLRTMIFRGGLKDVSPNKVLGDVMTEDQYNSDGEEFVKEEKTKRRVWHLSDNEDNEKKNKKEKNEKKGKNEKKMTFKKKKGGSYVVTWDSDAFTDVDSSDDDKVKYDESENDYIESENDSDDDELSNEQLMNMLEQADSIIKKKNKKCKELQKKLDALEQSFDELNATHERQKEAHNKLGKAHTKLEKAHSLLLEQDKERLIIHHHHHSYLYY